jgi:UDP-glucuronate decarboxylase
VRIKVVRIYNTYGPRVHPFDGRVVSNFIRQALAGEDITLYGDGSQTRSFCFVDDLIDGLIKMMEAPDECTGPVNLGNPDEFTVHELAKKVVSIAGSHSKVTLGRPLPADDPARRRPDISLAKSALGWHPRVSLDDGLRKTIDWFRTIRLSDYRPPTPNY